MFSRLPPVTLALLIANIAVYLLQQVMPESMLIQFALWPLGPHQIVGQIGGAPVYAGFEPWQLVTYAFLHGSPTHIIFNMLALYMFGGQIEESLGARHYAIYYFVCAVGAAIAQLIVVNYWTGGFYPTLGASGGVFGLLLAFAVLFPQARIAFMFVPVPLPAPIFVMLYGALELFLGVTGTQAGVAHFAHLGGMLVGFVLLQYWRGKFPIKPRNVLLR